MAEDAGAKLRESLAKQREGWQERLRNEHEQLKGRIIGLKGFINSSEFYSVHDHEKGLLSSQLGAMESYFNILQQRLKHHSGSDK